MRHPTAQAIDKFNKLLKFSEDQYSQDWEHECADPLRVEEFINCYNESTYSDDERFTLMGLILSSFNDYHGESPGDSKIWEALKNILLSDIKLHKDHIEYYICVDSETEEEWFPITSLMRTLVGSE